MVKQMELNRTRRAEIEKYGNRIPSEIRNCFAELNEEVIPISSSPEINEVDDE
jgi:hypothetical protein